MTRTPSTATPPSSASSGGARDALSDQTFRRIYIASFLSNTGRWMQSAAMGVLAWKLTESSVYLGAVIFAQLGPMAILSLLGGSLADSSNRRTLLLATQTWQMVWTALLAALVINDTIDPGLLLVLVFVIGLGQGVYAPVFTSVLPTLAGPNNLQAAISLNSTQTNAARVVGPAIGGWLTSQVGFAEVFAINAASYLVVIAAIFVTTLPPSTSRASGFVDRVFGGFRVAWRAPQVGAPLLTMALFSLFCLPFIGQLPAIAEVRLGVDSQSSEYGYFYALFGLGALIGALMVGTTLRSIPRAIVVRLALVGFAVCLGWLATLRSIDIAYAAIFLLGIAYFVLPTSLATMWQEHIDDSIRGRVSAIWVLTFGGTVPFANIVAGPIVEATSLPTVMFGGSVAALVLAVLVRLRPGPIVGEDLLR